MPGEYGAPLEYGMMAQERGYGGYPGPPMPMHPGYITYMGGFPAYPQGMRSYLSIFDSCNFQSRR